MSNQDGRSTTSKQRSTRQPQMRRTTMRRPAMAKAAETDRVLGDYEVGYCRPPVATRFTTTGNPKGRPKGSKNYATILREKLNAKVTVREGGRRRRMSKASSG